jgi:hypothetical protein
MLDRSKVLAVCVDGIFYGIHQQTYEALNKAKEALKRTEKELLSDGLDVDLYIVERRKCENL